MLGLQLPVLFFYDALITLISALVGILVVGVGLILLHFPERTPLTITFGLGELENVERVEIVWPDGMRQVIGDIELDRTVVVEQPGGR